VNSMHKQCLVSAVVFAVAVAVAKMFSVLFMGAQQLWSSHSSVSKGACLIKFMRNSQKSAHQNYL